MKLARSFFLRIYLALIGALMLFALLSALWWRLASTNDHARHQQTAQLAGEIALRLLPAAAAGAQPMREALEDWHRRSGIDLAVFDERGNEVAAVGRPIGMPIDGALGYVIRSPQGPAFTAPLPDGRRLALRPPSRFDAGTVGRRWPGVLGMLLLAAIAVALVSYPIARRLTARLERLERGVDAIGQGDLKARVSVEGHDEVAALALSLNRSAERIEALVQSQRSLLANASHELRSPLARIRMGVELLAAQPDVGPGRMARPDRGDDAVSEAGINVSAELRTELAKDIGELDQLIEEILLASRLEAEQQGRSRAPGLNRLAPGAAADLELVDLMALCAEECARVDAQLRLADPTDPIELRGDARLLRRLIRNLLENARRYSGPADVELTLTKAKPGSIALSVGDRGPGVPAEERERIFEPFYRVRGASEWQGGVGLGLSLARQIAERHGARIACTVRPDGGTLFTVQFELQ